MSKTHIIEKVFLPWLLPFRSKSLISALTCRSWNSRGKGGFFSRVWPVLTPFVLLIIYYYAFGVVLNLRQGAGNVSYALYMFSGMAVFNIFAESLNGGASSVITQPGYVKNAIFPLEVLPLSATGCALFSGLIYLGITFLAAAFSCGLSLRILWIFFLLIPYLMFCSGVALFSGAASVYFRDFPQIAVLLQQGLFFLTPIIYRMDLIPPSCRYIITANPLTGYVEAVHSILFGTPFSGWHTLWLNGIIFYLTGFLFFHKTQKGFADVL